jgi:hypothetical protein
MRILFVIIIVASLIGLSFISKTKAADNRKDIKSVNGSYSPVAVLELFTSEGCSSCPPADNLLPQLAKLDSNIIPLSFHVDYWNRLGWTDPFSKSEYSERQREYVSQLNLESAYTPQLVVNGEYELVGSDGEKAESTIKDALKEKSKVRLSIDSVITSGQKLSFTVHAEGDFKKTNLLAALVQKQATMKVKAGENKGTTLSHINIVRSLSKQTAAVKNEFELTVPANLTSGNWKLVVFTQQNDLKITGAALYDPHAGIKGF